MLFGCRGRTLRPVPPALPDSFSCAVHITADDLAIDAAWTVSHGESAFTINAPAELRGVTVRCTADGNSMTLDGVETMLPDTSPFVRIADAYRAFVLASPEGELTAQGWLYDLSEKGFTVLQDADSGLPRRLSMLENGITVAYKTVR